MQQRNIGNYGVLIYDGSCGFCSKFIGRNSPFFERYGVTVAPLQEAWVRELTGLEESVLSEAIHIKTHRGELLRGVDCCSYLARHIWWLRPVGILMSSRALKPLFARAYQIIAARRQTISKFCGLQSTPKN